MKVSLTIYADFESFTVNMDTCDNDPDNSYTKQYQKHIQS